MEKTRRVNLAAANSFHGDKLIRLSANDSSSFKHGYVQIRHTSFPIFIYIYIDAISTAFNRDDISSFGFHRRVEIAARRGGELVFVEIRNTGYRPREIDWTIALRKQSKFGSRGWTCFEKADFHRKMVIML